MINQYPYSDAHELNLDWIILKVKELIAAWAETSAAWETQQQAFDELKAFVNDYFDNLDVQQEINNKIDDLVLNGTLSELIAPYVASGLPSVVADQIAAVVAAQISAVVAAQLPAVAAEQLPAIVATETAGQAAAWLETHVNPDTGYVIDDSLTIAGAAADAKAAGDAIDELKSFLTTVSFIIPRAYYWAWYKHDDGDYTDDNFSQNLSIYESDVFENIPCDVKIEVVGVNGVQIRDNSTAGTITYGKSLLYKKGDKIRFLVRERIDGSTTNEPNASILDVIKITLTVEGWLYFLENYTCTKDAIWDTYGYYWSSSRRGARIPLQTRYGLKYPCYKATKAIMRYAVSVYDIYLFGQTEGNFNPTSMVSNSQNVTFDITDTFSWVSQSISSTDQTIYFNTQEYVKTTFGLRNPWLIRQQYGRTASACSHGDFYYYLSDNNEIGLRKISKDTLEVIETYAIYESAVGHANGSNLVGDKWYVSDWYDPNVCHVIDLTNDEPTVDNDVYLPVTNYYPTAVRGIIYVVNDYIRHSLTWFNEGDSSRGKLVFVTWLLSYASDGTERWKPCSEKSIPIFGIIQDICIVNDVVYAPLSKDQDPNKYEWRGTFAWNMKTDQFCLFYNTNRTECESIFADDNVLKVALADGEMCVMNILTLDWSKLDKMNISRRAWSDLHARS